MARRRVDMAHPQSDDWPRPRRYERAQFLLAAAAEALVLGLFLALFLFGLPIIAAVLP